MLVAGDVKDSAFCERVVREVVRRLGRLDVLVNSAAFQGHAESLTEVTDERLDETLRTNVSGYFRPVREQSPVPRAGSQAEAPAER